MARAQEGDQNAYRQLLGEIAPYIRSLARRRLNSPMDIEDAVQDVLLTIHRLRHTYDPRRPVAPWLATIAKYRLIDFYRGEKRKRVRERMLEPTYVTSESSQSNKIHEKADQEKLVKAINRLPASQREAIRLLKLEELTLKEASLESGLSIGALKTATHRAIRTLRKMLVMGDG